MSEQTTVPVMAEYVRAVWARHLKIVVDEIGPESNYFILGGYSLMAAEICEEISNETGVQVPFHVLLQAPSLSQFTEKLVALYNAETE